MDSLDVNEAEVFALVFRCCELLHLDGTDAILEGNSFSAIQ